MFGNAITENWGALENLVPDHQPQQKGPVAILGVVFDNVTVTQAVRRIEKMIASRKPHYVVTANVDFLTQARRDIELQRVLLNAPLVLCDGTPLVWASRLLGSPLPERVAGADLVPELIRLAAQKKYRLFFLGATEESATQAIANVHAQFPDIEIDHYSPPFRPLLEMDDAEIIRRIRAAKPDMLFVAFGCPKAEKWMAMHLRALGVPVAIGVGGTIDFLAGRVKRAPVWMQRGGVEWIYRLVQEPRRLFKRYVSDFCFFGGAIFRQGWKMRQRRVENKIVSRSVPILTERTWQRIAAAECFDKESVETDAAHWEKIALAERNCLLDCADVTFIDSAAVALLVRLHKKMRSRGRQLILISPSAAVRDALKLMHIENYFEIAGDAIEAREIIESRAREQKIALITPTQPLPLQGEITNTNVEKLWRRTRAAMKRRAFGRRLLIDLADVRFMDTSGVKMLLHMQEFAVRWGIRLAFCNPSDAVRNVLHSAKLDHLIKQAA
jgi:N-acetylglucosaminyldiphosphoundecaprenol N-acetyl-beta-D-mannosaminyltransferase